MSSIILRDLSYAIAYAQRVAKRYYYRIPYEDRITWSEEDLAQDFLTHLIAKQDKFNDGQPARPWIRTVIWNRASTTIGNIWTERRRNVSLADTGIDFGSVTRCRNGDEEETEIIIVDHLTPEVLLETVQEIVKKMAKKVTATVEEVKALAEQFEVEFNGDDVQGTLDNVLECTMNDMSDDDFDALADDIKARLKELGEAVEAETLTVSTSTKKKRGGGGGGPGRSNPDGPVAKIRENFKAGIQTVQEMEAKLKELKVECSPATIKTQVGRLRKEAGLTTGARGRAPATSGILYKIREAYNEKGLKTVAEVSKYLDGEKLEYSPATVKTQVGRLRKEEGLTNKPAAKEPAAEKSAPKASTKKASTKKAAPKAAAKKGATTTSRRRRRSAS